MNFFLKLPNILCNFTTEQEHTDQIRDCHQRIGNIPENSISIFRSRVHPKYTTKEKTRRYTILNWCVPTDIQMLFPRAQLLRCKLPSCLPSTSSAKGGNSRNTPPISQLTKSWWTNWGKTVSLTPTICCIHPPTAIEYILETVQQGILHYSAVQFLKNGRILQGVINHKPFQLESGSW